ncbi:MAG TPA: hypothetical protein VLX61_15755 [Anaerolineales bacterium]|nr:hypothetical protein [Anaerolineales bacterium]
MPTLTRWFIRTSFICLVLAAMLALLMAILPMFNFGNAGNLSVIYIHLFVLGWLTELAFGVVYWMFPKYSAEKPRGHGALGWWTYALLNLGLLLRAIAEPSNASHPNSVSGWVLVLSALLQFLAGLFFVINSWSRVRGR